MNTILSYTICDKCGARAEVLFCDGTHPSEDVSCESCGWWETDDFEDDDDGTGNDLPTEFWCELTEIERVRLERPAYADE